jgi:hypothetical protein
VDTGSRQENASNQESKTGPRRGPAFLEFLMTKWIGAALLAVTMVLGNAASIGPASAAPLPAAVQKPQAAEATDFSARRRIRHYRRYAYRPYYYDRPTYYRPYPYAVPLPFFLGFGFGPWW